MARQEREMELIKILGSFIHEQFPEVDMKDPKACADAYGRMYFGENFIRSGPAEWERGTHAEVLKTSYYFWEGEDETPAGADQTFPQAEGA